MKFHEAIAAGIGHIQENKTRAGLSILGIFIGIASVLYQQMHAITYLLPKMGISEVKKSVDIFA